MLGLVAVTGVLHQLFIKLLPLLEPGEPDPDSLAGLPPEPWP